MTEVASADRCRRVISAAFPALRVEEVRYLAEGWDSPVFEVNGSLVFRFPKRAPVDATLRKEIRLLSELAPRLPVPIPQFTHASGPILDHPWHVVGYPKLAGVPLAALPLTDATIEALAPGRPSTPPYGRRCGWPTAASRPPARRSSTASR